LPSAPTATPRQQLLASAAIASACALLLAIVASALGGCGSNSSSGTSADPATVAPGTSALYGGATVRPSGSEKQDAQALAQALTRERDPYVRLLAVLQTPGSPQLSFEHDVAPWLGPHAGVFVSSLGSSSSLLAPLAKGLLHGSSASAYPFGNAGAQGAIVMDTSDSSKASSFLNAQARRAGAHATNYRGLSYQATAGGVAFGLVDRFAVIGSESGLRSVIDTTLGGGSLARQSGYSKLLASAPADALAHVYVNPTALTQGQQAGATKAGSQEGLSSALGLLAGTRETNISLIPSATSVALDADALESGGSGGASGILSADPEGARALEQLPGESWLAIGLANVGPNLGRDVQGLQSLTSLGGALGGSSAGASTSGLGLGSLIGGLTAPLKALGADTPQAKHDFASWMGSAGIFATGASLLELKAAVVIESKDPALSHEAVAKLGEELRKAGGSVAPASIAGADAAVGVRLSGLPVVLYIADGRDSSGDTRFVLGLGEASVETALSPSSTMSGAQTRTAAAAALGEGTQPSLIVDLPTLVSLLEGIGLTEAPEIAPFVPALRGATTLAGGGRSLGNGVERLRLVLGLQKQGG
jgi:Protein of unknown function (DUF3352)